MGDQQFRLFINNLKEDIDESALKKKISEFGSVSSVEIKKRKNIIGNQTPAFAYINVNTSYENLQKCFKDFSTHKFNGTFIDISIAKESFMERLKREREEANKVSLCNEISSLNKNQLTEINGKTGSLLIEKKTTPSLKISSSKTAINHHHFNNKVNDNSECKESSSSNSQNQTETKSDTRNTLISISEEKRLHSILKKKVEYQNQKSLIQKALSKIDVKPKAKIIFDEYEISDSTVLSKPSKNKSLDKQTKNSYEKPRSNFKLFDDEDEEETDEIDDENFEVKKHFEGTKGQKLLELQSRYKNDKRFTLDSRFLEDGSSEESDALEFEKVNKSTPDENEKDEKEQQLRILEQVLGKKITSTKLVHKESSNSNKKLVGMLRFDPDQEEHLKYEMKRETDKKEVKRKKRKNNEEEDHQNELREALDDKPQVSTEKFYKVSDILKTSLQNSQQFSLSSTFKHPDNNNEKDESEEYATTAIQIKKSSFHSEFNPFRYDSSSDDSEDEKGQENNSDNKLNQKDSSSDLNQEERSLGSSKFWSESFFFKNDDYRLQEGLDFVKRLGVEEQSDFVKLRRSIKEVARAKVRNNQRKNKQFKKRLGGKKRIKIKRALKR